MHPHYPTVISAALTFAMFFAHAASAQVTDRMKATAPEKMMPADKALKLRECEKQMVNTRLKWRTTPASWMLAFGPRQNKLGYHHSRFGPKRTFESCHPMFAFGGKVDMFSTSRNVCF